MMLVAITAMHGRHALSRAWAEHTAQLFDRVYVSITEGDELLGSICDDAGFFVIQVPNNPLAGKFNAAMSAAMGDGMTRAMILGSDDFVSPAWVKAAREEEGDYLYPYQSGVMDAATQKAYVIHKVSLSGALRHGAGRVVSRKLVEGVGGELWPAMSNRGLDSGSHHRILRAGFEAKVVTAEGIPVTDVKTEDNLWPASTWEHSGRPVTADQALHMVSPSVRQKIDALAKTH